MKDPANDPDPDVAELVKLWPIPVGAVKSWNARDRSVAAARQSEGSVAEAQRKLHRVLALRENGFPEKSLYGAQLSNPLDTTALGHARAFAKMPVRMLLLAGGVGTGKTTAASWLALGRDDERPGFIRAGELERRGRYDRTLLPWLKERTSLVIDDLGVELLDSKGVFISLLDEVIDAAYGRRRIVVITTNLTFDELGQRYGSRVLSRFEQVGVAASCGMRDLRKERPDEG